MRVANQAFRLGLIKSTKHADEAIDANLCGLANRRTLLGAAW